MVKTRQRFGQHFLRDTFIIQRIIDCMQLQASDHCIEIGPGEGVLTTPAFALCQNIMAIEIDNDLAARLQSQYAHQPTFQLLNQDVLTVDFAAIIGDKSARIFGNLPYNISTPILFHIVKALPKIIDCHFMLQKEVVDRISAKPGSKTYGRLSVMMQYYFKVDALFDIPPSAFDPPPQVNSSFMRLVPHGSSPFAACDTTQLGEVVRRAFAHRRKTLVNNLKGFISKEQLLAANIDLTARAEQLSVADYVNITEISGTER